MHVLKSKCVSCRESTTNQRSRLLMEPLMKHGRTLLLCHSSSYQAAKPDHMQEKRRPIHNKTTTSKISTGITPGTAGECGGSTGGRGARQAGVSSPHLRVINHLLSPQYPFVVLCATRYTLLLALGYMLVTSDSSSSSSSSRNRYSRLA